MNMIDERLNIVCVGDFKQLAVKAFEIFSESALSAVSEKGRFNVAISGGKTPESFYHLLGSRQESLAEFPWAGTELFWVDERCVPPTSAESNYKLAHDTFLKNVPISAASVHRIVGEMSDYTQSANDYEKLLRNIFNLKSSQLPRFDLMVLGMGADGHIGSLLPNSYALFDTDDLVSVVYQVGGLNRITLTHPVMCSSKKLMVLISGAEKAEIVHDVFLGKQDEVRYPVHTLWPILDKVVWLLDDAAAALI